MLDDIPQADGIKGRPILADFLQLDRMQPVGDFRQSAPGLGNCLGGNIHAIHRIVAICELQKVPGRATGIKNTCLRRHKLLHQPQAGLILALCRPLIAKTGVGLMEIGIQPGKFIITWWASYLTKTTTITGHYLVTFRHKQPAQGPIMAKQTLITIGHVAFPYLAEIHTRTSVEAPELKQLLKSVHLRQHELSCVS